MTELVLTRGIGKPTNCRSCKKAIVFAFHEATKKNAPFEEDPAGVWTIENGTAKHVGSADPAQLELGAPRPATRYTSHFSTCPQAPNWRRK